MIIITKRFLRNRANGYRNKLKHLQELYESYMISDEEYDKKSSEYYHRLKEDEDILNDE